MSATAVVTVVSRLGRSRAHRPHTFATAAELLPVAGLREDGVLLRTDGALVRYLEVLPRNPLVMDEAEAERMGQGFAALLARLPAGQALQTHVQATPVALDEVVGDYRAGVEKAAAPLDGSSPERAAALRRLADVHVESLEVHGRHGAPGGEDRDTARQAPPGPTGRR